MPHAVCDHESFWKVQGTNDDTSAENRLQLALCAASATDDEVINDDCHEM